MSEYTDRTCGIGLPEDDQSMEEIKVIDLTIGVFFDGTANNKYNSGSGKKSGGSYNGSWTNVAQLWNGYYNKTEDLVEKVYLEGIGTVTPIPKKEYKSLSVGWTKGDADIDDDKLGSSGKGDDTYQGTGFGFESNGINAKIERACKLVTLKLVKMVNQKDFKSATVQSITIDVFGFSRGAAAARSFVSRIKANVGTVSENKEVSLKLHHLSKQTKLKNVDITVRFMGLFDTVSSFNPGFSRNPNFSNDVGELALRIPAGVDKVVHLVAADEYRSYFSVTNIASAGGVGTEIVLPGAHSDIGGGYAAVEAEEILMSGENHIGDRDCRGYMSLVQLRNENWLPADWYTEKKQTTPGGTVRKSRDSNRYVRNEYAKIPLNVMYNYTSKVGNIRFFADKRKDAVAILHTHTDLLALKKRIDEVSLCGSGFHTINNNRIVWSNGSEDDLKKVKAVRAGFIHLSAYDSTAHKATPNNQRNIIAG